MSINFSDLQDLRKVIFTSLGKQILAAAFKRNDKKLVSALLNNNTIDD